MSFTEGSIGGDIERIDLDQLRGFLLQARPIARRAGARGSEPQGSNGIAIAPKLTSDGNALLLINPHTSFYFRSELQMTQRRGPRRLWRRDLGSVLHLSGLQPARRLDAHVERRR